MDLPPASSSELGIGPHIIQFSQIVNMGNNAIFVIFMFNLGTIVLVSVCVCVCVCVCV